MYTYQANMNYSDRVQGETFASYVSLDLKICRFFFSFFLLLNLYINSNFFYPNLHPEFSWQWAAVAII